MLAGQASAAQDPVVVACDDEPDEPVTGVVVVEEPLLPEEPLEVDPEEVSADPEPDVVDVEVDDVSLDVEAFAALVSCHT